jgi:hypothetical protein
MNITSNYIIADGKFHSNILKLKGFDSDRIIYSNYKKKLDEDVKILKTHSRAFLVFFEGSLISSHFVSNSNMIEISNKFMNEQNYKCIIKPHPADRNQYNNLPSEMFEVINRNECLDEILQKYKPEFAFIGDSSVYVDLLSKGIKSFQVLSEGSLSIISDDLDIIEGYSDFLNKIIKWRSKSEYEKEDHFNSQILFYHGEKDNLSE